MPKKTKTLAKLKQEAQKIFNQYIRARDKGQPCISCGQHKPLQAGHYFAVSTHDGLRFDEDNVHGECAYCNCFNESHLIMYGTYLQAKIGTSRYFNLKDRAAIYKRDGYRFTRAEVQSIVDRYKAKIKTL